MNGHNPIIPEDDNRYTAYTTDHRARDEHRLEIRKKKRRKSFLRSSGIFLFVALLFFVTVCFFVFKLRNVSVEGNEMYSDDEIIAGAGISGLSNFFFVTEKSVVSHLAESYPAVRSVTVEKTIPSTVRIMVEESNPFFYLTLGVHTFILDDNLVVHRTAESIQEAESLNLRQLQLSGVKQCIAGKYIETDDKDIIEMFTVLYNELCENELINDITSIDLSNKFDIRFTLGSEYTVKIGNILNCDNKIAYVKKFLPEITSLDAHTIDISDENVQKVIVSRH